MWKLSNLTRILKKGDNQLIKNYRPISLLPIRGKSFVKNIFNNLYNHLITHHTKHQSGFRLRDSTTNQLIDLVNVIHHAFDCTKSLEVCSIFLDISKACDKVWHGGLIFKMRKNSVSGRLLKLLKIYLNNRKQIVITLLSIESGVSQGSILGPLLFLIYINDLERKIKANVNFLC